MLACDWLPIVDDIIIVNNGASENICSILQIKNIINNKYYGISLKEGSKDCLENFGQTSRKMWNLS